MQNVLITGGNRGIGLELCRQLARRGDRVIATCREASPELHASGAEIQAGVEVTDQASVDALCERLRDESIDILVNCAGILSNEPLDGLDFDRIRRQFEVNALGPLRITSTLRPSLHSGSKVFIITSRMGSIEDNTSGGMYGYRMSKAAVNAVGRSLAHDLRAEGIGVFLLHPGMVATDMTGRKGIPPEKSAANLIHRIDALTMDQSGSFWHAEGTVLPW